MYSVDGVRALLGQHSTTNKQSYIYARVSSAKQQGDLQRQIEDLQKAYPGHIIIKDIASGVNFKRKGLQTILGYVLSGVVSEVVVMHRDRLARIGFELLEYIFSKFGTKLVVHSKDEEEGADGKHDLADDLLAVTTLLVASHNGRRAAENRKRRREESEIKGKRIRNDKTSSNT
jgi:putative resolvase